MLIHSKLVGLSQPFPTLPRPPSPRVKPATHFARVVANILCGMQCGQYISNSQIYADEYAIKMMPGGIQNDKNFEKYLDLMYGGRYRKVDVFKKQYLGGRPPHESNLSLEDEEGDNGKRNLLKKIENKNCLLPLFTKAYIERMGGKIVGFSEDKLDKQNQSLVQNYESDEEWFHDNKGRRTKRKHSLKGGQRPVPGDHDYDSDQEWEHDGRGKRIKRKRSLKGGQRPIPGDIDYDSDEEWNHDEKGRRSKKKYPQKEGRKQMRTSKGKDYYSDEEEWQHDSNGQRIKKKVPIKSSQRPIPGNKPKDYNSDEEWLHDNKGRRIKRKKPLQGGQRPIPGDPDYNSEDEWHHDKQGRRVKRKKPLQGGQRPIPGDLDYDSDEEWQHDGKGKRIKRKYPLKNGQRPIPGDPDYDSDKEWQHDAKGRRIKRHQPLKGGQRPLPGDLDYNSDEDWEHDPMGKRTKRKRPRTVDQRPMPGDPDYDSNEEWLHDGKGKRIKRKYPLTAGGQRPIPGDPDYDSEKEWQHDAKGQRIKRRRSLKGGQRPIPGDLDYDSEEEWIHGKYGERVKRRYQQQPRNRNSKDQGTQRGNQGNGFGIANKPEQKFVKKRSIYSSKLGLVTPGSDHSGDSTDINLKNNPPRKPNDSKKLPLLQQTPEDLRNKQVLAMSETMLDKNFDTSTSTKNKRRSKFLSDENNPSGDTGEEAKTRIQKGPKLSDPTKRLRPPKGEDMKSKEWEDGKLPKLESTVDMRQRVRSMSVIKRQSIDPTKLPSLYHIEDTTENEQREDLFSADEQPKRISNLVQEPNPVEHLRQKQQMLLKKALEHPHTPTILELEQDNELTSYWAMARKFFKMPLKAPAIPIPDNLIIHIEKKYPNYQWPRGKPTALRYYPSGQPFCVVFKNGAGRVHYPHGGLAVIISAPGEAPSRVLAIRDPFDQFYFFDKAIMADLSCKGKGITYDENGISELQYNSEGGFRQEGHGKMLLQRWHWNSGGQRLILKLNRYIALKIMDITKIYLVFYGNKRGVRLNVGAGREVNLMSVASDLINDDSTTTSRQYTTPRSWKSPEDESLSNNNDYGGLVPQFSYNTSSQQRD